MYKKQMLNACMHACFALCMLLTIAQLLHISLSDYTPVSCRSLPEKLTRCIGRSFYTRLYGTYVFKQCTIDLLKTI